MLGDKLKRGYMRKCLIFISLSIFTLTAFAIDLCKTVKADFSGIYFFSIQNVKNATPIGETIPPEQVKIIVQNTTVKTNNAFYNITQSDVTGCGGINHKNKIEQYIYEVLPIK